MSHVLELLVQDDGSATDIICRVANDYSLTPTVVEAWIARSFPSLDALHEWRTQQRTAVQNQAVWRAEFEQVMQDANEWAKGVWVNCEPDGEPGWQYCCDRFFEARRIQKEDLRLGARKIFREVGQQYEVPRLLYLSNKKDI